MIIFWTENKDRKCNLSADGHQWGPKEVGIKNHLSEYENEEENFLCEKMVLQEIIIFEIFGMIN